MPEFKTAPTYSLVRHHSENDDSPSPIDLLTKPCPSVTVTGEKAILTYLENGVIRTIVIDPDNDTLNLEQLPQERISDYRLARIKQRYNKTGKLALADRQMLLQIWTSSR